MSQRLSDHLPPQNLEAERSVLGGILLDNEVLHEIALILVPEDFYRESHSTIFRAILDLYNEGRAVDAVTLGDELTLRGQFKLVGGHEMLLEIAGSVPHAANARYHADIVRQKSISRQVVQAATEIVKEGYSNLFTAQQLLDSAERRIFTIAEQQVSVSTLDGMALATGFNQRLQRALDGEILSGLSTGLPDLDDVILGMGRKKLIVLAGRPGTGKTALALGIAWNVARVQGCCTLFFSLEMGAEEITDRLVSHIASIDGRAFQHIELLTRMTDPECERRNIASAMISQSRLKIDDAPGQTLGRIGANARRHKLREGLSFVVIDYLSYIEEKEQHRNELLAAKLGRIVQGLKNLGKELDIPILLLHQLNRGPEQEQRPPRMSDLRDSGAIEQVADMVLLLDSKMSQDERSGPVDLIIAKNRGGQTGVVKLNFNKPYTRFESWALPGQIAAAQTQVVYSDDVDPDAATGVF